MPPRTTTTRAASSAPKAPTRGTARSRAQAPTTTNELVDGINKLAISKSEPKVRLTRTQTATSNAGSSNSAKSASRRPAATTAGKRKEKTTLEDSLPWACLAANERLRPIERAMQAMQATNTSIKALGELENSGYCYGSLKASSERNEWTDEKVVRLVDTCHVAFRVLRELDGQGVIGNKGAEVERTCQGVVSKCLNMGMIHKAMEALVEARPALLRLYKALDVEGSPDTAANLPTTSRPTSSSRSTVRAASKTTTSTSRSTPSTSVAEFSKSSLKNEQPAISVPSKWLELAWYPAPMEGTEMSEPVKNLLFMAMVSAWVGLITTSKGSEEVLVMMPTKPVSAKLNPLAMALTLPLTSITSPLYSLYRAIDTVNLPTASSLNLRYRQIALSALSMTISSFPHSKNSPTRLWEATHRAISIYVRTQHSNENLSEAAEVISNLIDWVERMVETRGENVKDWQSGKGWLGLMEMWIALGRRLNDTGIIDKALSLMTSSTSISTPPSTGISSGESFRSAIKGSPEVEITRIRGDLAKASLMFDKILSGQSAPAPDQQRIDALSLEDLNVLGQAINTLPNDEESKVLIDRVVRAWERVRRGCVKIIDRYGIEESCKVFVSEVERWSRAALDFVETVTGRIEINPSLADYLITGIIDTVCFLSQRYLSASSILLPRGYNLYRRVKSSTKVVDQIDWLRALSIAASNVGGRLFSQARMEGAIHLASLSCEWAVEVTKLGKAEELNEEGDKKLQQLNEGLAKRWEFLASCYQRHGQKEEVFVAYIQCLAYQPPSLLSKLALASSQPISKIFEPFTDFQNSLLRLSAFILYDPTLCIDLGLSLMKEMTTNSYKPYEVGAIGEKIMDILEDGAWKEEVARIVLDLGEGLLCVYGAAYPIRRLRVVARMMRIIVSSGQRMPRFDQLIQDADHLFAETNLGYDASLSMYKKEHYAYTLILRALKAYHFEGDPTPAVLENHKRSMEALREMLIPSTTSQEIKDGPRNRQPLGRTTTTRAVTTRGASARPTRGTKRAVSEPQKRASGKAMAGHTTASGVFDDLKKLTGLLGALASLLALLGQTLAQIETLRLIRAFQRSRDELIDDYVRRSSQLATEYFKLGKVSRAGNVFAQTYRTVLESKVLVDSGAKVELLLRWSCYLAGTGDIVNAREAYIEAQELNNDLEATKSKSHLLHVQVMNRCDTLERAAWSRTAFGAINAAQDNATGTIIHLSAAFRLWTRASDAICRIAEKQPSSNASALDAEDPFLVIPNPKQPKGADEPAKDESGPTAPQAAHFSGKHLHNLQWHVAHGLLDVTFDLASAYAARGSVRDAEYFLKVAGLVSETIKSGGIGARAGAREAELLFRLRKLEEVATKLENAAGLLCAEEGPEVVDLMRVQGDLYTGQGMIEEAGQMFQNTSSEIAGLDSVFAAAEALLPTPKKSSGLISSNTSGRSAQILRKSTSSKEPLLPATLAHVMRQHAWLLREAGSKEECAQLLSKLKNLPSTTEIKAEELLLQGRIALHEAIKQFKTDLFMSSLTESAVTMPMGIPEKKIKDRQSTRLSIQAVLTRAEDAFLSALDLVAAGGKVEGIRQACLALALLKAFQTSLGQGSESVTSFAASTLASSSSITLHRELLHAIETKFIDIGHGDIDWPSFDPPVVGKPNGDDVNLSDDLDDHDGKLRSYWQMIKSKYESKHIVAADAISLEDVPANWAVITINVSDDRNTMFISRHQNGHEPIVFCLPLDRQGRREGDDDIWTFDAAIGELETIVKASNEGARRAKHITTSEGKSEWWAERRALDKRMEELCVNLEFVWLGAFKTILSPRNRFSKADLSDFSDSLDKIFQAALSGGRNSKAKKCATKPHLDDALLESFACLSGKCKEEEVEDLVYFILDVYQFHGVPVALSELDIDQISLDVKGVLEKVETKQNKMSSALGEEHIFLALDKNTQPFPWESIPILRGRPVSRIPSLSFLLDQVAMGNHLRPSLTQSVVAADNYLDIKRTVNSRRTFYILNPSGDLARTETHFKPWIDEMVEKAGWKGIVGRPPTEMEMRAALRDYDLVLYFGHGGAEQYISSQKIRSLPQCATTMLWGCSSGHLKDQGDFDRTGTAWHYMVAGCPSLVGNLWDVTDRDIDRISEHVLKRGLHLDAAHQPQSRSRTRTLLPLSELSTVQAVNKARNECKLKYLNGAAPVVYGLPVYLH
ncbi:separase [Cryptococcus neoformans]|nr:separase [Cryptococcus neoformans var. grubii]